MSTDVKSRISFEQVKPLIGSVVSADREALFDPAVVAEIRQKLDERVVLVFPRVNLTNEEQIAFTDLLGQRQNLGFGTADEVHQVTLDKKAKGAPEYVLGTFFYHIDGMTTDGAPPYATLLSARRIAAEGGQTEFANTGAAYDQLPEKDKAEYEQLRVVHSIASSLRLIADAIPEKHKPRLGFGMSSERPLVYTRKSGRKSLLVGATADTVVGMDVPAGRALLARLQEWAGQPDFSYRHHWQEGDFVVWVNTAAMHRVIPYDAESGRMMHRTSVAAEF
jgi:alpha-ketoglutarate-dependent taurine dioxygenase